MDLLIVGLVGLVVGSIINLGVVRIPREGKTPLLSWPRCTRSNQPLAWWQVMPLLGWALQRGRAGNGKPIHWIFPLVELLSALMFVRIYQFWGLSPQFFYLVFVTCVLLLTGAIDWRVRFIYTLIILGAALIVLIWGPLVGMSWVNAVLGALVGGFSFALLFILAKVMFPAADAPFGLGDVYLAIFIGAAIGITSLAPALFYGMLMAGIMAAWVLWQRRRNPNGSPTYLAYGSFLCLGVLLYIAINGLTR